MTVTAPSDRHFRRKRVKPGRRASPRLWWKACALAAVVVCVTVPPAVVLARGAISSSRLSVTRIVVKGAERIARDEMDALLADIRGRNLLTLDIDAWLERLYDSRWVAHATIRRVFPDGVSIAVTERVAVGIARMSGGQYLVDSSGTAIVEYGPSYADLDLPVVDGLEAGGAGTEKVEAKRRAVAIRLFSALQRRPELASVISEIDLTDPSDVVFVLNGDRALVRAGHERFIERLETYLQFAPAIREQVPEIDYVDVRYGDQLIVGGPAARRGRTRDGRIDR